MDAAVALPPYHVDRLAQESGTNAGSNGMRHQAKVAEIDVGPTPAIQFEESRRFSAAVQCVDRKRRLAQQHGQFVIRHGAP